MNPISRLEMGYLEDGADKAGCPFPTENMCGIELWSALCTLTVTLKGTSLFCAIQRHGEANEKMAKL